MEEKNNYYMFEDVLNQEKAYEIFKTKVLEDERFMDEIHPKYLSIEEKYASYYFFEVWENNHAYYYRNKTTGESISGYIDIHHLKTDKEFILFNLDKNSAIPIDKEEFVLYDEEKYQRVYQELIQEIKEKALQGICSKHNQKPSKGIHIDIALFEGFESLQCDIFYEKIYIFRYRHEQRKKDFVSILSGSTQKFYFFEYVKKEEYQKYLMRYKKPLEFIPTQYMDLYYLDSYAVYLRTLKKLEYELPKQILRQIKNNIEYESYSQYEDYLKTGIYYFRIKKYLRKLPITKPSIQYRIYLSYLTLRYQKESGLFLYNCACMNLLPKNDIKEKIRFLEYSYSLGELEAKKKLYEHYSLSQYYDATMIKKYS